MILELGLTHFWFRRSSGCCRRRDASHPDVPVFKLPSQHTEESWNGEVTSG